ncbi:MAG: hypothetical protein K0U98_27085 [Deltaproteobacteria bacterium]|nr:hypothetical protein [Deltaproteobacteria bacterium]
MAGDYIVSEVGNPKRRWPVNREIFEKTYENLEKGLFRKKVVIEMIPLVEITGDSDAVVRIHTREGAIEVRAGDFYLARGVEGELYSFPNGKVDGDLEEASSSEVIPLASLRDPAP